MNELINKRVLLDALNTVAMKHHKCNIPMVEHDFRELINNMPTVGDTEIVRHGKWLHDLLVVPLSNTVKESIRCSECSTHWDIDCDFKYCPNCGAKMDEGDGTIRNDTY